MDDVEFQVLVRLLRLEYAEATVPGELRAAAALRAALVAVDDAAVEPA